MKEIQLEEYKILCAEKNSRIERLHTQSFSAITIIGAILAISLGLLPTLSQTISGFIEKKDFFSVFFLILLHGFLFAIPVFILTPISVKSGYNLTKLAAITAYISARYENLTENEIKWETVSKEIRLSGWNWLNNFLLNLHYFLLALISFGIYYVYNFLYILILWNLKNWCGAATLSVLIFVSCILIILLVKIFRSSSYKLNYLIKLDFYEKQFKKIN